MKIKLPLYLCMLITLTACEGQGESVDVQNALDKQEVSDVTPDRMKSDRYPESGVEMQLKQATPHVWYVQGVDGIATDNEGFISNAAVIIGENDIAVIDALGSPSLAQQLLDNIRKVSDKPIKWGIATHYHADHIYGLQVLKEHGATILAPVGADKYLDSPAAAERLDERRFSLEPFVNEKTRLVYPDRMLDQTEQIDLGGVLLTINYLGRAHSDGDLSIYVETDRVLISGDIIFEGRVPFVGDANTKQWLEVLGRMEKQDMVALIPGHGSLANEPNAVVSLMRKYLEALRNEMGTAVEEMTSFDEAYQAADWSEFKSLPAFDAANRINAYQVFLSLEAEMLAE